MQRIDVAVPGESAANGITLASNSKIMCSTMHFWKRGIMRFSFCLATLLMFVPTIGSAQPANQDAALSDAAAITVYKDFAVVRSTIDLDLKAGATDFTTTKVTRQLEPDSVVLRGRNGGKAVNVLEHKTMMPPLSIKMLCCASTRDVPLTSRLSSTAAIRKVNAWK